MARSPPVCLGDDFIEEFGYLSHCTNRTKSRIVRVDEASRRCGASVGTNEHPDGFFHGGVDRLEMTAVYDRLNGRFQIFG